MGRAGGCSGLEGVRWIGVGGALRGREGVADLKGVGDRAGGASGGGRV